MARVRNRYPRVPCVVPFCGCGATCYPPEPGLQIICPKHYRLVDRALKARRRRVRRELAKRGLSNTERAWRLERWLWRRMVIQAVSRAGAMGI